MTADHRFVTSPNFNDVKSVGKCRQQLNVRNVRGLAAFCFCLLEEKNSQQIVFAPISRPDKHAGLLKLYFEPLIKKLEFSILVAQSDLRFKIHKK